jgi:hypothetical protein
VTLGRLIEDLERHAQLLTEDWIIARERQEDDAPHWLHIAREQFRQRWGHTGHVDPKRLERDRAELNRIAADVIEFADKAVAHLGARFESNPTFDELHSAMDHVGKVFQSYNTLVRGVDQVLMPVVQEPWQRTFGVALFPPPSWAR